MGPRDRFRLRSLRSLRGLSLLSSQNLLLCTWVPSCSNSWKRQGHAHGRSLHGEILARLEASLLGERQHGVHSAGVAPTPQGAGNSVLQLSEADLAHITEQVAARLQARR